MKGLVIIMKKIRAVLLALCLGAMCALAACSSTKASADITLSGSTVSVSGSGAAVSGSTVTVTSPGTYKVTGTLDDGQLVVDTNGNVTLQLCGADITNLTDDAIHVKSGSVTIELADGTQNTAVSGTETAVSATSTENTADNSADTATSAAKTGDNTAKTSTTTAATTTGTAADDSDTDDASGAAIFSKDALTLTGSGSLTVNGYINNGIAGKTGVTISSGTVTVTSANDGIKSSEGAVTISSGTIKVTSGGDGISAETDLNISGGTFDITSGDGSEASNADGMQMPGNMKGGMMKDTVGNAQTTDDTSDDSASMKALKAGSSLTVSGGTFTISSTDHAVHSSGTIDITGGTFTIASSAGKGISGHGNVTISGKDTSVTITKATEGIESKAVLTVNDGTINITASDDGFNAGGGGTGFGQSADTADSGTHAIVINGGTVTIDASGDGIDSNGDLTVAGGTIIVNGPTSNGDGALDSGAESGGKISVTGGTIIALGASGMAEGFDDNSTQYSFLYNFSSSISAGTEITITDASGNVIYSCKTSKDCSSIEFSSPQLKEGGVYTVTAGTQKATVTLSSIAVNSASTGMGGGMKGGFGGAAGSTDSNGSTGTMPAAGPGGMRGGKGGMTRPDAATGATSAASSQSTAKTA